MGARSTAFRQFWRKLDTVELELPIPPELPPGMMTGLGVLGRRWPAGPCRRRRRITRAVPHGLGLVLLAGCASASNPELTTVSTPAPVTTEAPRTTLAPATTPAPLPSPLAEQVCQLLTDKEVRASVAVDVVSHTPAVAGPRSCTWAGGGDPGHRLLQLALSSPQWQEPSATGDAIGSPCVQGSTVTRSTLGDGEAWHATCRVDGLAVFLTARTTERSQLIDLVRFAVPRLGSVDRIAFGFGPKPSAGATSTTMPKAVAAPPECVAAWRAEVIAPPHCEEYPAAYNAIQKELKGG